MKFHPHFFIPAVLILCSSIMPATAQETTQTLTQEDKPTSASLSATPAAPVLAFLKKVEEKNKSTKSLEAQFSQVRFDAVFEEEVTSNGHFWYKAPGQFRASYDENKDTKTYASEIWMQNNRLTTYTPKLGQVEILEQKTGDEAPVNQMLLGFGLQVDKITKVFDVAEAPEKKGDALYGVQFRSRNLDQSMQYGLITIYFDSTKIEPAIIILEDDQSKTTVTLQKVKFNPVIDDKKFKTDWPASAQVFNYSQ